MIVIASYPIMHIGRSRKNYFAILPFIQFAFYPADDLIKGFLDLRLRILYGFFNVLLSFFGCYEVMCDFHHVINRRDDGLCRLRKPLINDVFTRLGDRWFALCHPSSIFKVPFLFGHILHVFLLH